MRWFLENNCQHSILVNELEDSLGTGERLRLVFHADCRNRCARQDHVFKSCGKAVYNATNRLEHGR